MKQSYPTANVIMLFTLLTPMLFGIVMGLPLGIFILPMIVASMLYGFLPALACGIWLAASGWLFWVLLAAGMAAVVSAWCFLPAAEETVDDKAA